MKIELLFTKDAPEIRYVKRSSKITKPDGTVVFEMKEFMAPEHWSQTACDILAQKYFRKTGVATTTEPIFESGVPEWLSRSKPAAHTFVHGPKLGRITNEIKGEHLAEQVFRRMAGCWTYWGWKAGYFKDKDSAFNYYKEMYYMLYTQMGAPNSPQWFNTGLHWAYGIDEKSEGHYYVDHETGEAKESFSAYEHPQPHACFIQSVEDTLTGENSIMRLWENEARLFKYGSGSGTNFSSIRGSKEPLSGGGESSGLMSFLNIGDAATGAIKSGGTTRRAAKMCIVDVDHPDIEEFINWKVKEELKVEALVKGSALVDGMETLSDDWDSEAYLTVSGQNSNNSVRVTDEFMRKAIEGGQSQRLRNRTDNLVTHKYVNAEDLLDQISYATWVCADPGIQFHDTINKWHTCPEGGEIRASNPCSEYMFLDNTACNLASLNLMKFKSDAEDRIIDVEKFEHAVRLWTITLDISVTMAQFPTKQIAEESYKYRTLGLGYANLGALLMSEGLPYDSVEARSVCAMITANMTGNAYKTSAELAIKLGAFEEYNANKGAMREVIEAHIASLTSKIDEPESLPGVDGELIYPNRNMWRGLPGLSSESGFRNAQVTVLAPTGTIGMIMDCDTMGIEPDFALVKTKQLAGGGTIQIVNQTVKTALEKLGHAPESIELFVCDIEKGLDWRQHLPPQDRGVFDCANDISPDGHLKMMAAAQPFLSGAISKTINMPQSATVEDVKNTFIQAWELGLKAVAIYRNNSKLSQPLVATTDDSEFRTFDAGDDFADFDDEDTDGIVGNEVPYIATFDDIAEQPDKSKGVSVFDEFEKLSPIGREDAIKRAFDSFVGVDSANGIRNARLPEHMFDVSPVRRKLPQKRGGYTQKAVIDGHKLYIKTGEYEDGSLGEIFITTHREGATLRAILDSLAIAVSIGLQHGTPLSKFVDIFTHTKFDPAGPVQGHDQIKICSSIVDYIFRDLGVHYLGREDLAHVKKAQEEVPTVSAGNGERAYVTGPKLFVDDVEIPITNASTGFKADETLSGSMVFGSGDINGLGLSEEDRRFTVPSNGYSGEACSVCKNFTLVRNGTCLLCKTCGATSGCS